MTAEQQGFRPDKQQVWEFLQTVPLGTIATLDETGHPQVATVAFSQTENLDFIIGTSENSRKAQNIEHDGRVAFVATDPSKRYTVQMEGTAQKLTDEDFDQYAEAHFAKLPASAPFRNIQGQCYILIKPHWLRFSDCNPYPWVLTEFTF